MLILVREQVMGLSALSVSHSLFSHQLPISISSVASPPHLGWKLVVLVIEPYGLV